nr:MAG TPA: hypothetical protein [Caudoviricetes sp.]
MSLQCPLQVCYNSIGQILTAESVGSILKNRVLFCC